MTFIYNFIFYSADICTVSVIGAFRSDAAVPSPPPLLRRFRRRNPRRRRSAIASSSSSSCLWWEKGRKNEFFLDPLVLKMLILSHHCHQPPLSSFRALKPHRCSSFLPKLHFFSRLQRFSVELQIAHGCFPLPRSSNLLFQFRPRVSIGEAGKCADRELGDENSDLVDFEDLGEDSEVFKKTLQLVECAMFASVAGLTYFLSNSLAVEVARINIQEFPIVLLSNDSLAKLDLPPDCWQKAVVFINCTYWELTNTRLPLRLWWSQEFIHIISF